MKQVKNIDDYIRTFPKNVQVILKKLRLVIRKAAPHAQEKIAYGIPTFTLNGNLVHFGGFKNHVSFFPTPDAIKAFKKELAAYQLSKGTIQFPINKPIPYDLVKKIVKYRVKENLSKQV